MSQNRLKNNCRNDSSSFPRLNQTPLRNHVGLREWDELFKHEQVRRSIHRVYHGLGLLEFSGNLPNPLDKKMIFLISRLPFGFTPQII
jgi:hypothetical protein